jgi:hypothetical protein
MGQPWLHEAMALVLREHGGLMYRDDLVDEIAARDLYRQDHGRGTHAPSDQMRLRAHQKPDWFECDDAPCTRIRLVTGGPGWTPTVRGVPVA